MQVSKWVTLGAGMIFILILAAYLNAQHLYYMAAILLTLPAVSYSLGWFTLRGIVFTRETPQAGRAGEEGLLRYRARNPTPFPRFFLTITDRLPDWIEFTADEPTMFNVPARTGPFGEDAGEVVVSHHVRYLRRGVVTLKSFDVTAIDPLGVFAFAQGVGDEAELVVYPAVQPLHSFDLTGSERYGWNEFTAAALRGVSVDPDGVREYTVGDPLRRIHWRQTARRGKLAVIEFEEPQSISLVILLDLNTIAYARHGGRPTLETAVTFAASLAHEAIRSGSGVRLILPEDLSEDETCRASFTAADGEGRGSERLLILMDALARVESVSEMTVSNVANRSVGALTPGSTLLVITPSTDRDLPIALSRYSASHSRVGVVYIDGASRAPGETERTRGAREQFFGNLRAINAYPFRCDVTSDVASNIPDRTETSLNGPT